MTSTSAPDRARTLLRVAAVLAAATAMSTVSGTAHAAAGSFGAPNRAHWGGSFGVSPAGSSYNGTQAVTQLQALAAATRAGSTTGSLISGSSTYSGQTSKLSVAVDGITAANVHITGPLTYQILESPTLEYIPLGTKDADTRAALQLLHAPNVHYVSEANTQGLINPADLIEQLYATDTPAIGGMTRSEHRGVVRYQVTLNVPSGERDEYPNTVTVTTDPTGRLTAFGDSYSTGTDIEQYTVRYGPQSVALPNPQDVVDGTQLQRATASLHLPQALAFVAEEGFVSGLPNSGIETVTQFRAAVRVVATDPDNDMGGIAITVVDVSNGVTLTAQNPYTNAIVTVHAVLNKYGWVDVTDSAGRPVQPSFPSNSAAARILSKSAVRSSFRG
jgi:hypothetical protein